MNNNKLTRAWKKLKHWHKGITIGLALGILKQILPIAKLGIWKSLAMLNFAFLISFITQTVFFSAIGFFVGYLIGKMKGETILDKKLDSAAKPWFIAGIIAYILGSLCCPFLAEYSKWTDASSAILGIMTILSLGIVYFFIACAITYIIYEKNIKKEWIILTIIFYIISVIYPLLTLGYDIYTFFIILIFPLIYGSLFVPFAFGTISSIFQDRLPTYIMIIFMALYNIMFFTWVYLEFINNKYRLFKKVILFIIFVILLLGMISCTNQLSHGF